MGFLAIDVILLTREFSFQVTGRFRCPDNHATLT